MLSLDEAAAMLIALDAGDELELERVTSAFAASASDDPLTTAALAAAAEALREAAGAPESELREAIDVAGARLEDAMIARDEAELHGIDAEHTLQPAPAPAPAVKRMDTEQSQPPAPSAPSAPSPGQLPEDADLDLLRDFIAEGRDFIEGAESALLRLENDPRDAEAINTVFRAFHTIKGTSAFLGLDHITTFAHHAESLLSGVRDRGIAFTGAYADLALQSTDMLGLLLDAVESASPGDPLAAPAGYELLLRAITAAEAGPGAGGVGPSSEIVGAEARAEAETPATHAALVPGAAPTGAGAEAGDGQPAAEGPTAGDGARPAASSGRGGGGADASVRVRTDRLDRLIDMVGELVIAQAMIAQDPTVKSAGTQDITRKVAHAGKIVRELQDLSMSMRMVPLKATFQKMARLTRDAAHRSGKQVELVIEGDDTEIDRNMVDIIGDPLVHMVRNAVDHGIEPPAARTEGRKPATGRLRLAAYHAGGSVVVEVEDDGKGLDRERIVRKEIGRAHV